MRLPPVRPATLLQSKAEATPSEAAPAVGVYKEARHAAAPEGRSVSHQATASVSDNAIHSLLLLPGADDFFWKLTNDLPLAFDQFQELDSADGQSDGSIVLSQFIEWMAMYGTPPGEAETVFNFVDSDQSGSIQLDELVTVAQKAKAVAEGMSSPGGSASDSPNGQPKRGKRGSLRLRKKGPCTRRLQGVGELALGFLWREPPDLAALMNASSGAAHDVSLLRAPQDANASLKGHLDESEVRLLEETEKVVASINHLKQAISHARLRTKYFSVASPRSGRSMELREAVLRHTIMTDMLFSSLQGSLVRLEPFECKHASTESKAAAGEMSIRAAMSIHSWTTVAALGVGVEKRIIASAWGAGILLLCVALPVFTWSVMSADEYSRVVSLPSAVCDSHTFRLIVSR